MRRALKQSGWSWELSPAGDLLPLASFNGFHTTTINNQGNPTMNDIRQVADDASIPKKQAAEIGDQ